MQEINKTYKYRLYPDEEQKTLLAKHFGCVRWVYNHFLNERKEQYLENGKSDNYYDQAKTLTSLKKQEETKWLKEVNSQTLQFALRCLDTAYKNFFRGDAQFPRFKSKRHKQSFTVPQNGKIVDGKLSIPKFKTDIPLNIHREVQGDIGKMAISKTANDKYYVSVFTTQNTQHLPKTGKKVGIDLGLKDYAITSDGRKLSNHRYLKRYERKLKKAQQHLSRKQKGSNSYENQRRKVAQLHEKVSNSRKDRLHKISKQLVEDYDVIVAEDLNVKGMVKNRRLSKHIADASWGTFTTYLSYKCNWYGKEFRTVDRFFPSSKMCHNCGWIKQDLGLQDREWTCDQCNETLDRDQNAALNILSAGTVEYKSGEKIRPGSN
jgi:putative transposase